MTPEEARAARAYIVSNEDWRNTRYLDSLGIPTVGVGFNLNRKDARSRIEALGLNFQAVRDGTTSLTDTQVDQLFQQDFNASVSAVAARISGFDALSPARKTVLIDMAFNLGAGGFGQFIHMISAVNSSDWARAEQEMRNSEWFNQVGTRGPRNASAMGTGATPVAGGGHAKPIDKAKDGKEGKDHSEKGKDRSDKGKDTKEGKDSSDKGKDTKEGKDSSDKGKDTKEGKDRSDKGKDSKEGKDRSDKGKDTKEGKDRSDKGKDRSDKGKDSKEGKDRSDKGKDRSDKGKDSKEGKDRSDKGKDSKEGKDRSDKGKDSKEGKDRSDKGKDSKEGKDRSDKGKDRIDIP